MIKRSRVQILETTSLQSRGKAAYILTLPKPHLVGASCTKPLENMRISLLDINYIPFQILETQKSIKIEHLIKVIKIEIFQRVDRGIK